MGGEREILQGMDVGMYLECCVGNRKQLRGGWRKQEEKVQRKLYISMGFRIPLRFKEAGQLEIFVNGRDMEGEMEI